MVKGQGSINLVNIVVNYLHAHDDRLQTTVYVCADLMT